MEATRSKAGILFSILFCMVVVGTCNFVKNKLFPIKNTVSTNAQSTVLYEKLKKVREKEQKQYEEKIQVLEIQKQGLDQLLTESNFQLRQARSKSINLKNQIQQAIPQVLENCPLADSLILLVQQYETANLVSENACDSSLTTLQEMVVNRDSSLCVHEQMETSLREEKQDDELRIWQLTENLNTAYKMQRRKTIQNKVLKGGLLVLTGLTTTLFITQQLK